MQISYKVSIPHPSTHQVVVEIRGKKPLNCNELTFFLPRWSPGSYLIREYSRHLSKLEAFNQLGEPLYFKQNDISTFELSFTKFTCQNPIDEFLIRYQVYCKELTVRTSHVDESHAFLHLPTLLMGLLNEHNNAPFQMGKSDVSDRIQIEFQFPPIFQKISTGLKELSGFPRDRFVYSADSYDELIDCPVEIGCQETDGFLVDGVEHELAYYGKMLPFDHPLKNDYQKIVQYILKYMQGAPYERYVFITHFIQGLGGGLEHLNSTALQFCPFQLQSRKGYLNYLNLVSHEFFHLWNVKRIRPFELGPFDYLKEAYTSMLWLAEGLTSLMDELFVYQAELMTKEEYLDFQKDNLNRYISVQGKKFHSLEQSSENAWIKLYRPDENSNNSSISYYLKGGIVFWCLHILLSEKNAGIRQVILDMWESYKSHPEHGLKKEDVYALVEKWGGELILSKFQSMIETTEEIDLETIARKAGINIAWEADSFVLGADFEFSHDRVLIKSVHLDGAFFDAGLNAGDEILAIDGMRVLKDRMQEASKFLLPEKRYLLTISRLGVLLEKSVVLKVGIRKIKELTVFDQHLFTKVFNEKI